MIFSRLVAWNTIYSDNSQMCSLSWMISQTLISNCLVNISIWVSTERFNLTCPVAHLKKFALETMKKLKAFQAFTESLDKNTTRQSEIFEHNKHLKTSLSPFLLLLKPPTRQPQLPEIHQLSTPTFLPNVFQCCTLWMVITATACMELQRARHRSSHFNLSTHLIFTIVEGRYYYYTPYMRT